MGLSNILAQKNLDESNNIFCCSNNIFKDKRIPINLKISKSRTTNNKQYRLQSIQVNGNNAAYALNNRILFYQLDGFRVNNQLHILPVHLMKPKVKVWFRRVKHSSSQHAFEKFSCYTSWQKFGTKTIKKQKNKTHQKLAEALEIYTEW